METVEVPVATLLKFKKIGRFALIAGFSVLVIMFFHVLIDFFYHT